VKQLIGISALALLLACSCDSEQGISATDQWNPGDLRINEYVACDSEDRNEFGKKADWLELKNVSNHTLTINSNEWFITDNPNKPDKYPLPAAELAPGELLLVWCDKQDTQGQDTHANFKLSAKDDQLAIFLQDESDLQLIDLVTVQSHEKGQSVVLLQNDWTFSNQPTPGSPNSFSKSNFLSSNEQFGS